MPQSPVKECEDALIRMWRALVGPLDAPRAGRWRFDVQEPTHQAANCQGCHGGATWSASTIDVTPPPAIAEITAGQLTGFVCKVGAFDATRLNKLKGGNQLDQLNTDGANGVLGFNIPSLLNTFASAPFLHRGSALTIDEVAENVQHRSRGTASIDVLAVAADRAKVARVVALIDTTTTPSHERTIG